MAVTKRTSPRQHYHIEIREPGEPKRFEGTYTYDQGRHEGANAAVRELARRAARDLGPCAEVRRIGVGSWAVTLWNAPADALLSVETVERITTTYYSTRVCFDAAHLEA